MLFFFFALKCLECSSVEVRLGGPVPHLNLQFSLRVTLLVKLTVKFIE